MSFKEHYQTKILPQVRKDLGIGNVMETPRIEKIVINMSIGSFVTLHKDYSSLKSDLSLIAGQAPQVLKSRKAISNFKLRQGMVVGMSVTLRGDRMFYFLEKLIKIVLPRVRDFRGISKKSFDKEGNFNFGIREHTIFPEVPQLDVVKPHGLQITVKMKSRGSQDSEALLTALGFPFTRS
ncbi:MAG TPA: 50S ribosomal protein L5 [bacterium]|nr:50S ribosomal protein L5 [bacterium]